VKTSNKKIAQKVIDEKSTRENAKQVIDWFTSSVEGSQTLSEMIDMDAYLIEEDLNNESYISNKSSERIFDKIQKKIRHKTIKRKVSFSLLISLPLILILGIGYFIEDTVDIFGESYLRETYNPKGKTSSHIIFQDGSEVFLNSDSKIVYPSKFNLKQRNVYLEGEAYFKVASNKKRPFYVHIGNTFVKVTGTSFNVKAYNNDNNIFVVLDEGKITFNTNKKDQYYLPQGHEIIYNKKNMTASIYKFENSHLASKWIEDKIYFNDTPLSEALKTLERRYNVKFEIANKETLNYTFNLTTSQPSVEQILDEMKKISPIKFKRLNENKIIIL